MDALTRALKRRRHAYRGGADAPDKVETPDKAETTDEFIRRLGL